MKNSRTFSNKHILDRRAVSLPSDITSDGCTLCTRFLVGLKTGTIKTIRGHFTNRHTLNATLRSLPPADKWIVLSNASNKESAQREADKLLVEYVISDGKRVAGNLYSRDFGDTSIAKLTPEQFKERKVQQRVELREFMKSIC